MLSYPGQDLFLRDYLGSFLLFFETSGKKERNKEKRKRERKEGREGKSRPNPGEGESGRGGKIDQ